MDVADPKSIDSVRLKLVQLVDSITVLQNQVHHYSISAQEPTTQNPGVPAWPELLARFNLLLSHVVGLGALMSSVGDPAPAGPGGRDLKRERWEQSTVAPREPIEESKDWLVGMLLRTKQVTFSGWSAYAGWAQDRWLIEGFHFADARGRVAPLGPYPGASSSVYLPGNICLGDRGTQRAYLLRS